MPSSPSGRNSVGTTGIHMPTIAQVVEWLHSDEAAWIIELARREGVPEYAADRLAEALDRKWGEMQ